MTTPLTEPQLRQMATMALKPGPWKHDAPVVYVREENGWDWDGPCTRCGAEQPEEDCSVPPSDDRPWPVIVAELLQKKVRSVDMIMKTLCLDDPLKALMWFILLEPMKQAEILLDKCLKVQVPK